MKTLYILLTAFLVSLSAGSLSAQHGGHSHDEEETGPCNLGNAEVKNVRYKVNNKFVSQLQGNIREGSVVTVLFDIEPNTEVTRFSLVSYTAPGNTVDYNKAHAYEVHDYATGIYGPGHHEVDVHVAKHYFQVDFVKGCVIWHLGPEPNSDNYYERQNRLIARGTGGTNPCHGNHRKVQICHVPKGNPANAHTITVSEEAAKAHIGRHGGDYYGPCRTGEDTGKTVMVDVNCTTATVSSNLTIQTVTLLLDDSSTQEFVINSQTAMVSPSDEYDGYYIVGVYVALAGETGMGDFYINSQFPDCDDERPPLPVKLTSFEAKKLTPNVVQLNWATAQEINNDYMAIEKSSDIENWKEVCRVPGHGNSDAEHAYTCTDNNAGEYGQNIVYYRPKQVDYNGTYEYFSTIRVRLQDAAYATTVDNVYPNPAKDRLNIRYNSAENGIFNIRLIGMDGKSLVQNQFVAKSGTQVIDIDLMENKLKPGFYVLEIQSETEVFRQKVYKQ